jgi:hypothetical protein
MAGLLAEQLGDATKPSPCVDAGSASKRRSEERKKLRVLLVEDEVRMSKLVSRALVRARFGADCWQRVLPFKSTQCEALVTSWLN